MFNSNSVSISVSDDESDELGRMRVRVRRKRKKLGHRFKNEFFRRVVRSLVKYWSLLILLPAIGLLLYEAWSIGWKSPQLNNKSEKPSLVHSELNASSEKKSEGNLNRLDPITRVIHGVRERCLQILPPEELEHLEIPVREAATSPVKKLLYRAENDGPLLGGYNTRSEEHTEATRFNLFTGNQTLDQRREMFQVNGTVSINCGFYSESGGFKISNEDKNYMQSCDIVVSTCAFGGGGDLYQPIGMSKASLQKVFSNLETLLWRSNSVLVISEHGARSSVYDEAKAVVKKNKAKPEEVEVQLARYRHGGLPEDKRFNGKKDNFDRANIRKHGNHYGFYGLNEKVQDGFDHAAFGTELILTGPTKGMGRTVK
ncbi:uncharacterized protein LOC133714248 isoform X2 [Rosa rugosa]|uniref:uncharacterized protein LOC133714248 isoform X2 n=1 Tax=Rosa rugosa TaxID=74645 RepID=UPI002B409F5E|nr:uncharacterized protein LOC133714248 isoform X2 [Rosa rugosa]